MDGFSAIKMTALGRPQFLVGVPPPCTHTERIAVPLTTWNILQLIIKMLPCQVLFANFLYHCHSRHDGRSGFLRQFDLPEVCSVALFPTQTAPVLRGACEMAPVLQLLGCAAGEGRHGRS